MTPRDGISSWTALKKEKLCERSSAHKPSLFSDEGSPFSMLPLEAVWEKGKDQHLTAIP
jgi:hypothetical protein